MHLTITMARILIYIYVGVQVRIRNKSWKTPEIRKHKLHKEETYNQSRHTHKGDIHTRRWHKHGGDIYMEHMEKRGNIYTEWTYIKIARTMPSPFNIFLSQCLPFSMSSLLTSSPLHVFPSQCLPFSMSSISMSSSVHAIPSTLNVLPSQCLYWPVCWPRPHTPTTNPFHHLDGGKLSIIGYTTSLSITTKNGSLVLDIFLSGLELTTNCSQGQSSKSRVSTTKWSHWTVDLRSSL